MATTLDDDIAFGPANAAEVEAIIAAYTAFERHNATFNETVRELMKLGDSYDEAFRVVSEWADGLTHDEVTS